ncbi:Ig-like domain-containing protein, partial [Bacteroidota bacterium]
NIDGPGCESHTNLISNPGFESNLDSWTSSGAAIPVSDNTYEGNGAVKLNGLGRLEQVVKVNPNSTYVSSAWIQLPGTNMSNVWHNAYLGLKEFGYSATKLTYFRPDYTYQSIQFTTGDSDTSVTVIFENTNASHLAYADNFSLVEAKDLSYKEILVPVSEITISPAELNMVVGDTSALTASVLPDSATDKSITWESSNDTIAKVDGNGLVTAIEEGTALITAKSTGNNTVSATALVRVSSDSTNNIGSISSQMELIIYPNPYQNGGIILAMPDISDVSVSIYDITGKVVFTKNYRGISRIKIKSQQLKLNNGIYLVKCKSKDNWSVQRLIVNM